MRVAIISDIHGNLPALEAVLARIENLHVDAIHCLGDIVGYGPFPNECVEIVRVRCTHVIKGNHDSGLIGETPIDDFNRFGQEAIRWTAKKITNAHLEYLRQLPSRVVENSYTLVHASPVKPEQWSYVMSSLEARNCFRAFDTELCFIGHTHVPVVFSEDGAIGTFRPELRHLINVGSVGQPRDGNPQAAFGMLDTNIPSYAIERMSYDIKTTVDAIESAGLPRFLGQRLIQGM
jgi:diadenosine tetraphosphatase ApaH/serine/threonine PP2A family protein phosphatase